MSVHFRATFFRTRLVFCLLLSPVAQAEALRLTSSTQEPYFLPRYWSRRRREQAGSAEP